MAAKERRGSCSGHWILLDPVRIAMWNIAVVQGLSFLIVLRWTFIVGRVSSVACEVDWAL